MNTPNEQGLFHKFNVTRVDARDLPGEKHHGCSYFVLDLDHDPHAIPALAAYADSCASEYPVLATDLRRQVLKTLSTRNEFVPVPETTLPNGLVVPAFRVGRYYASRGPDDTPMSVVDAVPWTGISYQEARDACTKAGYGLLTETQALAIAWQASLQAANWSSGKVGEGAMHQGIHKGRVSEAQPGDYLANITDENRWFELANGERLCDVAGNIYGWIFDDVQGDANGLTTVIKADSVSLNAPYPSLEKGMGWRPSSECDWSGLALVRGGSGAPGRMPACSISAATG